MKMQLHIPGLKTPLPSDAKIESVIITIVEDGEPYHIEVSSIDIDHINGEFRGTLPTRGNYRKVIS